jgi:adenosine deaminase
MSPKEAPLSELELQKLEKGQIHEHIDCSLVAEFMLKRHCEEGFDKVSPRLPRSIVMDWRAAQTIRSSKEGRQAKELIEYLEGRAARAYQLWLSRFASKSLKNYVQAIRDHILPIMQTSLDLYEITRRRIEDAVSDGHIFLELRFAPQLHTAGGLTLDQVMDAVIAAVREAPIPVKLIICSLRHENLLAHNPVNDLADLAIKYDEVGVFDLAADEAAFPGVLDWFVSPAKRVQATGKILDIHMFETNEPTSQDMVRLAELYVELTSQERRRLASIMKKVAALCAKMSSTTKMSSRLDLFDQIAALLDEVEGLIFRAGRLGHGIRGNRQGTYVLGVCPTSNVVTGQVASFAEHPVSKLLRAGKLVTINTDGTTFTRVNLTKEYAKLQESPHNFRLADFYTCNRIALAATSFAPEVKAQLRAKLYQGYRRRIEGAK